MTNLIDRMKDLRRWNDPKSFHKKPLGKVKPISNTPIHMPFLSRMVSEWVIKKRENKE